MTADQTVHDEIATALSQVLNRTVEIQGSTKIVEDLGMDSLAVMNFIMAIEDRYDISIPLDRVAQVETVDDLTRAIQQLGGKA
ncbi:MAG: acyl carrier protein [Caulobacteraceae bacterium]|nr:acyl carrier protein [Caulobacteraceae bacterium]